MNFRNSRKFYLAILVTFLFGCSGGGLGSSGPSSGGGGNIVNAATLPIDPTTLTHTGKLPSQMVVLTDSGTIPATFQYSENTNIFNATGYTYFVRLYPDGSVDSKEFVIPPGQVLVVTDIIRNNLLYIVHIQSLSNLNQNNQMSYGYPDNTFISGFTVLSGAHLILPYTSLPTPIPGMVTIYGYLMAYS